MPAAARAQPGTAVAHPIAACLAGEIAPAVALARLLGATRDVDAVERAVRDAACLRTGTRGGARLAALRALLPTLQQHCGAIAPLLAEHPADGDVAPDPARTIERQRAFFDRAVAASEEASVALYSLGSTALLARASREIVHWLAARGLLGPRHSVLQIGCGIGRIEALLARRVRAAYGVDISPRMIAAARRRCAHLPNVHFQVTAGRDLAPFAATTLDLVYAVDSFPYLVQCGEAVVEMHLREACRVLRPGGSLAIFNYSYRDDPARDGSDLARLAARSGLHLLLAGARPFAAWDGLVFHLRRRA